MKKFYLLLLACRSSLDGQINGRKKSKNHLSANHRQLTYANSTFHGFGSHFQG